MSLHEIVLPETKPETEWVRGRALQKVSPTYSHSILQTYISMSVYQWVDTGEYGRVGTEWRFRVTPPGEITRPLVPDIGYLSYGAMAADAPRDEVEVPLAAPTVAFEVLSPDDRRADIEDKINTYLLAGTSAVVYVDPRRACVTVYESDERRTLLPGDTLELSAMPEFMLDVAAMFERAAR